MDSPPLKQANRIKNARGRRVAQLDPIALYLLRRHEVIEADTLRAIVNEKGIRITRWERVALITGICCAVLVVIFLFVDVLRGGLRGALLAKYGPLTTMCLGPWIAWDTLKQKRFGNVVAAMLKYRRCPHCAYDLRMLPTDPADGATVCPECGCAWTLPDDARERREDGDGRE